MRSALLVSELSGFVAKGRDMTAVDEYFRTSTMPLSWEGRKTV